MTELKADGENHVGLLHHFSGDIIAAQTSYHTQGQWVVLRQHTFSGQGGGCGHSHALCQRRDLRSGAGTPSTAAQQHNRPLGLLQYLDRLVDFVAGRGRTVGGQAGQFSVALIVRPGIFLPEGPPWTLDKYGSGTATDRHLGGSLHQLRHFVHMGQARLPLGHWLEHLLGVYHLGARTAVPGGQPIPLHLRTDGDDGDGGVVRLRQARNKLDGTAAGGGVAYSDTAADTGVGVRGKGGINLILHENMPDTVPLIQNSVVERQSLPAGHTKYRRHTIVGQQAGHYISSMLFHPLVHTFLI